MNQSAIIISERAMTEERGKAAESIIRIANQRAARGAQVPEKTVSQSIRKAAVHTPGALLL